ncbi:MAG: putative Chitin binding protein, partial [Streblomastix strix]
SYKQRGTDRASSDTNQLTPGSFSQIFAVDLDQYPVIYNFKSFGTTSADDYYETNNNQVGYLGYRGDKSILLLPVQINSKDLVAVYFSPYTDYSEITTLQFPDTIQKISFGSLAGFRNLAHLTIPFLGLDVHDDQARLGYLFSRLEEERNLNIDVPSSLINLSLSQARTIATDAFSNCPNLMTVSLPDTLISIGADAFRSCTNLIAINFPSSLTSIGNNAFENCLNLTMVFLPNSILTIDDDCFTNNPEITIYAQASTKPGSWASSWNEPSQPVFWDIIEVLEQNCFFITVNTINSKPITTIANHAFKNVAALQTLTLSENVLTIGDEAFMDCFGLQNINFSNQLTSIGSKAFANCSGLTSIVLPNSLNYIGVGAFKSTTYLENIAIPFVGSQRGIYSDVHFADIFGGLSSVPSSLTHVAINGGTIIPTDSFSNLTNLTEVVIHIGVTHVESYAFRNCSSLQTISFPNSVTRLDANIFTNSPLVSISLPFVGGGEYYDTHHVTDDGLFRFIFQQIPWTLRTVKIQRGEIKQEAFAGFTQIENIILDEVTAIGSRAFLDCRGFSSLVLPDSIQTLANECLLDTGITEITLPFLGGTADDFYGTLNYLFGVAKSNTLRKVTIIGGIGIGDYAFMDWDLLEEINLPDSITSFGDRVFNYCTSLTSVTLPSGMLYLPDTTFANCSSLESVVLPENIIYFGNYVFFECTKLVNIVLPPNLQSIGIYAFKDCPSLELITLPDSLTFLDNSAFYGCTGLTYLIIPPDPITISDSAFTGCNPLTFFLQRSTVPVSWSWMVGLGTVYVSSEWTLNDGIPMPLMGEEQYIYLQWGYRA